MHYIANTLGQTGLIHAFGRYLLGFTFFGQNCIWVYYDIILAVQNLVAAPCDHIQIQTIYTVSLGSKPLGSIADARSLVHPPHMMFGLVEKVPYTGDYCHFGRAVAGDRNNFFKALAPQGSQDFLKIVIAGTCADLHCAAAVGGSTAVEILKAVEYQTVNLFSHGQR
jgi:hypothetical protein